MVLADVQREMWGLIESNIDTVPQLETLVLIYGTAGYGLRSKSMRSACPAAGRQIEKSE